MAVAAGGLSRPRRLDLIDPMFRDLFLYRHADKSSSGKVRHDIRGAELASLSVVPFAIDQELDAGVLVLPDQVDSLGHCTELRNYFRHFRVDRISAARLLDERFPEENGELIAAWLALQKQRSAGAILR